ncbi:hypothetical protein QFZ27_001652 [Inquilinus ginsengisoli]|uniref:UPF0158 family protein n=1 Tax=Inquilinus ginsengisoli TaxID=363840 RepID=UPI003D219A03
MVDTDQVTVDRTEFLVAYEFVSFGGVGENMAYISLDTGKTHLVSASVDMMEEEAVPDDLETSDRYLAMPDKNELGLGRDLVLRFAARELPDDHDAVKDMFRRKGAYRNFRHLLETRDVLQRWYDFENRETENALKVWCEENAIQLADRSMKSP